MFTAIEKFEKNGNISKCYYIQYSPSQINTINTAISQICISIPRDDLVISLSNSNLDIIFDVLQAATYNRYVDNSDSGLVNLGPVVLFCNWKLTTSSEKNLEDISHAQVVLLMKKLISNSKTGDDLSIGFDRVRNRRQRKLTNNKNIESNHPFTIRLREIIGFAERQKYLLRIMI